MKPVTSKMIGMKNLLYLFLACLTIVFSSCAVTNEIHINKNYSGTYAMTLDFGGVLDMMEAFGEEGEGEMGMLDDVFDDGQADQVDSMFNSVEGISNADLTKGEDNKMVFSFDFEDFESLDRVLAKMNEGLASSGDMMGGGDMMMPGLNGVSVPSFTKNGKTITHQATLPVDDMSSMMEENDMAGMEDMLTSMFDVQIIMTFDRKVKEVSVNNLDIMSQEKKMVKTRVDMKKFYEEGSYSIDVKLK